MPQLTDTPPHVEKIVAEDYGRMPSAQKWKLIADAYRFGRHLHAAGLRDRNPAITAEDMILLKLEWYRLGGEQSTQQWNDILGILRAQQGKLNDRHLVVWATDLKVDDLLAKARSEV